MSAPADLLRPLCNAQNRASYQLSVSDPRRSVEIILPQTDTPGARDVGVPAAFDALMLNWGSAERRNESRELLADIDKAAMAEAGSPLLKLPADKRVEVVAAMTKSTSPATRPTTAHYAAEFLREGVIV